MDWIGWALAVIGIAVSVPIGIMIGRRNRRKPDVRVAHDFAQVVRPADWLMTGGLTINYDDVAIERVSRTFIAVWNHRGDTVDGSDLVDADPLRIEVSEEDAILQVRTVAFSRPQIGVAPQNSKDGSELTSRSISFDFLDEGDGAVIEVLHRGTEPAFLKGTIKGATIKARVAALDRASRAMLRMTWMRRLLFPLARRLNVAMAGVVLGLVVVMGVVLIPYVSRDVELVSPSSYDLTTLEGQAEYATEVRRSGLDPTPPLFYAAVASPLVLFVPIIILIMLSARGAVPRSVLAVDLDPASDDDMKLAKRQSRPQRY